MADDEKIPDAADTDLDDEEEFEEDDEEDEDGTTEDGEVINEG